MSLGVNYTAGMKPVSPGAFAQPAPAPVLRPAPSAPLQTFQLPTATVRLSGVTLINTRAPAPTAPTQLTKAAIAQLTTSQVAAIPSRSAPSNPGPSLRATGLGVSSFRTPLQSIGGGSPLPALVPTSSTPTAAPRAPSALRPFVKSGDSVSVAPLLAPPAAADDPASMIPTRDSGFLGPGDAPYLNPSSWGNRPQTTGYPPLSSVYDPVASAPSPILLAVAAVAIFLLLRGS